MREKKRNRNGEDAQKRNVRIVRKEIKNLLMELIGYEV